MGGDNFFSKLASVDPLARALHLPGSDKYAQAVAQRNAGATDVNGGPFTGIAPTLAAANGGYTAGSPGAPANWQQINLGNDPSGLFGAATKLNNLAVNANPAGGGSLGKLPSTSLNNPTVPPQSQNAAYGQNPYAQAAGRAATQTPWSG
jgi:hypothetical protein